MEGRTSLPIFAPYRLIQENDMTLLAVIIYILIGILAGFMGGLLGIGGGLIAVPAMLMTFTMLNLPIDHAMQVAVGTSLAAMVFTSASSAFAHYRLKGIYWSAFFGLAPGVILGAILGAIVADFLPSRHLAMFFGVLSFAIGIYFLFPSTSKAIEEVHIDQHWFYMMMIGLLIGILSSMMGIGGGIATVPILVSMHVPLRNAISTSAATGFIIAVVGAISFFLLGLKHNTFNGGVGYLYIPAFIVIGFTALIAAPFGARMAYILPTQILRKVFGCYLMVVGLVMIY